MKSMRDLINIMEAADRRQDRIRRRMGRGQGKIYSVYMNIGRYDWNAMTQAIDEEHAKQNLLSFFKQNIQNHNEEYGYDEEYEHDHTISAHSMEEEELYDYELTPEEAPEAYEEMYRTGYYVYDEGT